MRSMSWRCPALARCCCVRRPSGSTTSTCSTAAGVMSCPSTRRRSAWRRRASSKHSAPASPSCAPASASPNVQALGAYADRRVIAADRLLKLPDQVDDRVAAASLVKGLTAHYLLRTTHAVAEGETILVHAAAGGVGLLLCQWAKQLGARI